MTIRATIHERGNGFPDVGDYVAGGADGQVYRIVAQPNTRIHTGAQGSGASDYMYAEVELADWDDISEAEYDDMTCLARLIDDDDA